MFQCFTMPPSKRLTNHTVPGYRGFSRFKHSPRWTNDLSLFFRRFFCLLIHCSFASFPIDLRILLDKHCLYFTGQPMCRTIVRIVYEKWHFYFSWLLFLGVIRQTARHVFSVHCVAYSINMTVVGVYASFYAPAFEAKPTPQYYGNFVRIFEISSIRMVYGWLFLFTHVDGWCFAYFFHVHGLLILYAFDVCVCVYI